MNEFSRSELILGKEAIEKLKKSHVAVFGIGGVGGFTTEALARCGVGKITIIDNDKVCLSNINRQIIALHSTIGRYKTDIMAERLKDINPQIEIVNRQCYFSAETKHEFDFLEYDYIADAIDSVTSKLLLIEMAKEKNIPIISCMGAGNKIDPSQLRISDIYKTSMCPLAKVMRTELRKRNIQNLKVIYSPETPLKPIDDNAESCKQNPVQSATESTNSSGHRRRAIPGSVSFVPSVAGLLMAGEIIRDIIQGFSNKSK